MDAGKLDTKGFNVKSDCRSENDEGDYDTYMKHQLLYKDEVIWTLGTSSHSNIGGSWGTDSSVSISGKFLEISWTHCGRTVGGGHDSSESRTYTLQSIAEAAAAIKMESAASLAIGAGK